MVEKLKLFFQQFQSQGMLFFKGLTRGRKIALGASFMVIMVALLSVALWQPTLRYELAFSGLSQEDKHGVLSYLKKNNIKDFKLEGDTIYFPDSKALDYKMMLAQEGLPSTGVGVGWEKFDDRAFGLTDFDQRINRLRAVQGELSRTINKLEPVQSSRVHIVMPDNAVFAEDKKPTTASISLRLQKGGTLSQR